MADTNWLPTPQERGLVDDEIPLPVGYCLACHKEVIATVKLAALGHLQWCCIFCDEPILQEDGGLKALPAHALVERGYRVVAPEAARLHKEGGTSEASEGGCSTCSKGGCDS